MVLSNTFGGKAMGIPPQEPDVQINNSEVDIMKSSSSGLREMLGINDRSGNGFKQMLSVKEDVTESGFEKMLGVGGKRKGGFEEMIKMKGDGIGLLGKKSNTSKLLKEYGMSAKTKDKKLDKIFDTGNDSLKKIDMFIGTKKSPKMKNNPLMMNPLKTVKINNIIPNTKINFESKFKNFIGSNTESIARKRIKQQRKLNKFGDFDKDGVPNILDCDPFDKKKQGVVHDIYNRFTGGGNIEPPQAPEGYEVDTPAGPIETYSTTEQPEGEYQKTLTGEPVQEETFIGDTMEGQEKLSKYTQPENINPNLAQKIGIGLQNVYKASGLPNYFEEKNERKEAISKIREKARMKALEELEKKKVQNIYKDELGKLGLLPKSRSKEKQAIYTVDKYGRLAKKGKDTIVSGVHEASRDISKGVDVATPGMLGNKIDSLVGMRTGMGYREMVGAGSGLPYSVKIAESVGSPEDVVKLSTVPRNVQPVQPVQSVQPQMSQPREYNPEGPNSPPPAPGMVWSERSKRWVRYPRGSYDKKSGYQKSY